MYWTWLRLETYELKAEKESTYQNSYVSMASFKFQHIKGERLTVATTNNPEEISLLEEQARQLAQRRLNGEK